MVGQDERLLSHFFRKRAILRQRLSGGNYKVLSDAQDEGAPAESETVVRRWQPARQGFTSS